MAEDRANNTAERIVKLICTTLQEKGYPVYRQRKLEDYEIRRPPLFSNGLTVDLLVEGLPNLPPRVIISVKHQDVSGTTEEKMHYHVKYIIQQSYGYPTILVMSGTHWRTRPPFVQWLKEQIGEWLIHVFMGFDELAEWLIRFGIRREDLPPVPLNGRYLSGDPVDGEQPWLL